MKLIFCLALFVSAGVAGVSIGTAETSGMDPFCAN